MNAFGTPGVIQPVTTADIAAIDVLGWDLASLSAPAPTTLPDLTISGLNRFDTAVGFHLNNTGQAAAAASTAGLYLSTDSKLTTSDILLGAFSSPGLDAGGSDAENMLLSLPTNLKVGIYYVGVIADEKGQISESSETNNASAATPIVVGSSSANILTGTDNTDIYLV